MQAQVPAQFRPRQEAGRKSEVQRAFSPAIPKVGGLGFTTDHSRQMNWAIYWNETSISLQDTESKKLLD